MVLRGSVAKRIRAEEVAVFLADAITLVVVLVFVLAVDIAVRVKDGFLATDADNEPIPPDVTFDTEADQATDIGTFVPVLIVFVTGIVGPGLGFCVKNPVMSLFLVPDKVQAHPEEATVESDVNADTHLGMLFIQTRSINELEVQGRNEFAIDSVQRKESTGLDEPREIAIIKEAVVFRTVLDTSQGQRTFQVESVRNLEVETTVRLNDRSVGAFLSLVAAVFTHVAAVLLCDVHMQAPSVAVRDRTAQETVKVRHRFRNCSPFAAFTDDDIRQVLDQIGVNTAKETTDGNTRIRIVDIAKRNSENASEVRMLRIAVRSRLDILRIGTEFTNQVVGIEVDVCRVIKDAHVIHDVSRILTHRFDTSECCKGRPYTKDPKCGAHGGYSF